MDWGGSFIRDLLEELSVLQTDSSMTGTLRTEAHRVTVKIP